MQELSSEGRDMSCHQLRQSCRALPRHACWSCMLVTCETLTHIICHVSCGDSVATFIRIRDNVFVFLVGLLGLVYLQMCSKDADCLLHISATLILAQFPVWATAAQQLPFNLASKTKAEESRRRTQEGKQPSGLDKLMKSSNTNWQTG